MPTDTRFKKGFAVESSTNTALGLASELSSMEEEAAKGSFGCSSEQIYSPIQIKKYAKDASEDLPAMRVVAINTSEKGGFGLRDEPEDSGENTGENSGEDIEGPFEGGIVPYAYDLDPYFFDNYDDDSSTTEGGTLEAGTEGEASTEGETEKKSIVEKSDFNHVISESEDDRDLDIQRNNKITEVRTMGLRGPMLMSGWGYDIGDKPVPRLAETGDDSFKFSKDLGTDRSKWKTGPVHLMWDDERKVWSGGLPMLMGVATSDIEAPDDPAHPTTFTIQVLRKNDPAVDEDGEEANPELEPPFTTLPSQDSDKIEELTLSNFDPSLSQELITQNRKNPLTNRIDPEADPPGKHSWPDNPSLVWVLAIKMNYEWVPFYVGCPDLCKTPQHCADAFSDDEFYIDTYGEDAVRDPDNWICEDGECKFTPPPPDPDPPPEEPST